MSDIPITEPRCPFKLGAVRKGIEAPEGPGRDANKPLMRKRKANYVPSPTGTLPPTFSMTGILTTAEAAAFLRMHVKTLKRLVRARVVPCVRVTARKWIFRRTSLNAWMERREK